MLDGASYPSRNEEYLLYQTLVGSWPLEPMSAEDERTYAGRITSYMLKAMREAKWYTSWLNPSEPHEAAMVRFVESVLAPDNTAFRADFLEFARRVARCGIYNSLAQLAIKVAAPGVPDFYQGTELWDFSLVDPDNRRPVDYARRQALLQDLAHRRETIGPVALTAELLADPDAPALKLFTTAAMLRARRERRELFESGGYEGLRAEGRHHEHVFAFRRHLAGRQLLLVVPRLLAPLLPDLDTPPLGARTWDDTRVTLPGDAPLQFKDLLTGRCLTASEQDGTTALALAEVFEHFPVALLEAQ